MGLKRSLGSLQVQLITLGAVIGSSYFLGLGGLIARLGPSIVFAFALGGVIVWLVSLAMGELCASMPREGSFVSFASELVGRPFAAGVGWSYWFDWITYIASEMIGGGIILHKFVPAVPAMAWTVALGVAVSVFNLMDVKWFGLIDSALSLIKVLAAVAFAVLGLLIWAGLTGGEFLGTSNLLAGSDDLGAALFPAGLAALFLSMVMILVNCAGIEVISLSSGETDDPTRHVARDSRRVALSTIALFVVPLAILVLVFPWNQSSLASPVFADALASHGFRWAAAAFSFVTLTAAISCANSGLYGTARALFGLGKEGLAPRWFTRTNARGVPVAATWVTILGCWAFLPCIVFFEGSTLYVWLLAVAGFTGAVCWISISWSHLRYRKQRDGRAPPWCYASVALQVAVLGIIPFSPEFRGCLVIGIPALVVPMLIVWWRQRSR